LVLQEIAEWADDAGRESDPSQETIARATGSSRRDVRTALKHLEAQGLIEKTGEAIPRVRGTVYALPRVADWFPHGRPPVDNHANSGGYDRPSPPVDNENNSGGYDRPSSAQLGRDSGGYSRHSFLEVKNKTSRARAREACGNCEDLGWIETAGGMATRCPVCNPEPKQKRGTR
jgi:biotin operon repressor